MWGLAALAARQWGYTSNVCVSAVRGQEGISPVSVRHVTGTSVIQGYFCHASTYEVSKMLFSGHG